MNPALVGLVKDSIVPIEVSDHARDQARLRFAGFKAARIIDEVREALRHGRLGTLAPGCTAYENHLYVWTPDRTRVYPLRQHQNGTTFVVVTTLYGHEAVRP